MTAFIGQRLRQDAAGHRRVLPCWSRLAFGVIAILHLAAIFLVPLLLAPLGLAPVAAGAGDGAGLTACRRALTLCAGAAATGARWCRAPSPRRSRSILFLAFGIALSPIGGRARVIATLVVRAAVAWPIAGLMLRSLYGALSGRLVVRLRAVSVV